MKKTHILSSLIMALVILFGTVGTAAAEEPAVAVTGIIQSIKPDTDTETDVTTILVKLLDSSNKSKTYRISVENAVTLLLVTIDSVTTLPVVDETMVGQEITLEPDMIIEDDVIVTEGDHPVASLLAKYFQVDYETIFGYHEDGFGFGTIAQSLWLANKVGDITLAGDILDARQTGDYSAFVPEGETAPTNWGQLRKALLGRDGKANLGMIVSGKAEPLEGEEITGEDPATDPTTISGAGNSDNGQGNHAKPENGKKPEKVKGPKNKKP